MTSSDETRPEIKAAIIPVTMFQQNCTVLWSEAGKNATVIDPGGELERILSLVKDQGLTVEKLVLTHGHIDHAGGAAELSELVKAPIVGPHEADRFLLDGLEELAPKYGVEGVRNCSPDQWLEEGDTVAMAGYDFAVLHCPGHSPGSVAFHQPELRLLIAGDVIFQGSVGRTDLPGGDHDTLIGSIKDKLFPLGDDVTFICGHGPASTIGRERASNPFLA